MISVYPLFGQRYGVGDITAAAMMVTTLASFITLSLAIWRLARGPSLADRIVALELTSMLMVGIVLIGVASGNSSRMIDVAAIIALVGFLGTATFAYYLGQENFDD